MPANPQPIFIKQGDVSSNNASTTSALMGQTLTTAAADYTGVSANNLKVFQADSTNGSFVQKIRFKSLGTNIASVARIYLNNGGVNTTATNNAFIGEISLPATTASATAATIEIDYPLNMALNPGFMIYVGLGTTVAAGWKATAIGGVY